MTLRVEELVRSEIAHAYPRFHLKVKRIHSFSAIPPISGTGTETVSPFFLSFYLSFFSLTLAVQRWRRIVPFWDAPLTDSPTFFARSHRYVQLNLSFPLLTYPGLSDPNPKPILPFPSQKHYDFCNVTSLASKGQDCSKPIIMPRDSSTKVVQTK